MAQTSDLLKITYHTDDETGMYQVGEIDFGISGSLEDYLRYYGMEGRNNILLTLCHLANEVTVAFNKIQSEEQCTTSERVKP
jgi:hypothetical protein